MTARQSRPFALFFLALLMLPCAGAVLWATPAKAADSTSITLKSIGNAPVDTSAPLGVGEALKIALAKADSLRTTQLDLESSKINERTMWYRLFPKLNLVANYSAPVIQSDSNGKRYKDSVNFSFSTGTYDPIAAYIGHGASRVAVKLSEVLHVISIQDMIEKIGDAFIDIDAADQEIAARKQLAEVMAGLVRYTGRRYAAGSIAALDHRLAEQRYEVANMELRGAVRKRTLLLMNLKTMIGLDEQDNVAFKTAGALVGGASRENLDQALEPQTLLRRNLSLKAQALRAKLEEYNITLAKSDHLPKFTFGFQTPDPLSNQQGNLPYYLQLQANLPVWAWGETLRNTDRARLKYQSELIKSRQMLVRLRQTAAELREHLEANAETAALAKSKEELARLDTKRKEIGFSSGNVAYADVVTTRETTIRARLEVIKAQQFLSQARINMQSITGNLIEKYARVNYGELEKD